MRQFFGELAAGAAFFLALATLLWSLTASAAPDQRRRTTFAQQDEGTVTCSMRTDTCSDGRKITTVRASPVPCETSPGVWEIVPPDTGCYSVRGLESWAQTTSYLSWGAELDRSPWRASSRGGTLTPLDDGYRVSNALGFFNSGWVHPALSVPTGSPVTGTWLLRGTVPDGTNIFVSGNETCTISGDFGSWTPVSCTKTSLTSENAFFSIYPCGQYTDRTCSVDVRAGWYTHTDTPGRPCWGGEAPVTCAADRHTISTEGWPVEAGRVELSVTLHSPVGGESLWLVNAGVLNVAGWELYIRSDRTLSFFAHGDGSTRYGSPSLEWEVCAPGTSCAPYRIAAEWGGSAVRLWRDGVLVYENTSADRMPFAELPEQAAIGYRGTANHLNGTISNLRWRTP